MRYINNRLLITKTDWNERVNEAKSKIACGEKVINDFSGLWTELKDDLKVLSSNKCWYCESSDIRSDGAIDHYRPKNKVHEAKEHNGYHWLAFDKDNFRFSCTFCNSRRTNKENDRIEGKGDYFPLEDESKRCYSKDDNINDENPLLIDPCDALEPGWIDFRGDGVPIPRYPKDDIKNRKAKTSIELYHLDHEEQNENRRQIAIDIENWVKEAVEAESETIRANRCRDIRARIQANAPYSSFAKRVLANHRDKDFVEDIFVTM
ncbi:MAG: hypothetical protein JXR56_01445 [Candidatus Cloacimonetes bacterium]|nr:hypothetical protein [Candidatus Cloacimonadota bacterium]